MNHANPNSNISTNTNSNTNTKSFNRAISSLISHYQAYDEEALKTYANAGLLRRAKKDVAAGKIQIIDDESIDDQSTKKPSATEVRLNSDSQIVTLPDNGLTHAKCDCPAVSACKHIVASVLYLQTLAGTQQKSNKLAKSNELAEENDAQDSVKSDSKPSIIDDGSTDHAKVQTNIEDLKTATEYKSPTVLNELLALQLEDLQKIAKTITKAKRLKAMAMALTYFETYPIATTTTTTDNDITQIDIEQNSINIQLANQSQRIRYIQGAGFSGMLSKIEKDTDSYHWLAILEVKRVYYSEQNFQPIKQWLMQSLQTDSTSNNPASNPYLMQQLPQSTLVLLEDIESEIQKLVTRGLTHIDAFAANRMHLNNTLARSHHLPRLATQLRQISGQMHDFVKGNNHINERQILFGLADLTAYLYQLKHCDGDELVTLRGKLRNAYDTDQNLPKLTLYPLAAEWWQSQGKARGLTLYFYEPNEQQIIDLTQARAQGQDLNFDKQSAWFNAVWLSSSQSLMNHVNTLSNPRFNANGGLAVSGSKVTEKSSLKDNYSDYLACVETVSVADWSELVQTWQDKLSLDSELDKVVVLNPTKIGELLVDEIEQCVWWQLADKANNQLRLRLDWDSDDAQSINSIKKLERLNMHDIKMVVAKVSFDQDKIELLPLTLILHDGLFHLNYDRVPTKKLTLKELLSGKISKLMSKKRRLDEIDVIKPMTLSHLICEPILTVVESLTANGRIQPTEGQIKQLRYQQKLASDAGLSIIANSIKSLYTTKNTTKTNTVETTEPINSLTISNTLQTISLLQLVYLCRQLLLLEVRMPVVINSE